MDVRTVAFLPIAANISSYFTSKLIDLGTKLKASFCAQSQALIALDFIRQDEEN